MKILLLSHFFHPSIGGIETVSEILASAFFNAGHEVRVLTWTKKHADKNFPFPLIRNPRLSSLLKEHIWADVVVENNPCVRLVWPNYFIKRPLVTVLHTWISRSNGYIALQDRLKLKNLSRACKVIACSKAIRSHCWPNSLVIPNPYQENKFKILDQISKNRDFVFLGRLVSDKGADLAISAFHRLLRSDRTRESDYSNLSLTIVGDGPERKILEQMVVNLELAKNVRFTGTLQDVTLVECLNKHRFILVPSLWEEPFGMVALEGMACGCVPIVSNCGGLPDAIGNAGLTFQQGNVDSLLSTMQRVLQDNDLERKLRKAATNHLLAHQRENVTNHYLSVLHNVVSNHS